MHKEIVHSTSAKVDEKNFLVEKNMKLTVNEVCVRVWVALFTFQFIMHLKANKTW